MERPGPFLGFGGPTRLDPGSASPIRCERGGTLRVAGLLRFGAIHIRLLAVLAVPCLAVAASAHAQQPRYAPQIDSLFSEWNRTTSPGCAAGVTRDGRLEFARGYGMADLDHRVPISPSAVFYLASVSKQFTAAAIGLAARQGHLSLDDDVRTWIPELPPYERPITIRHLVHHTSGVRDYLRLMSLAGVPWANVMTDEELLDLLARQTALNFESGSEHLYSNSGYFLLARIVERATGRSLREFAREHIFEPLGMYSTHFHDDAAEIVRNRAIGYEAGPDGPRMNHLWNFDKVGSGGVYSTVEDLARWESNFIQPRVGDRDFLRQIVRPGVLTTGDTLDYAFGLRLGRYRGKRTVGHGGSLMAFRTRFVRFPELGVAVIVLCNTPANTRHLAERIADAVIGDRLGLARPVAGGPAFIDFDSASIAARTGAYRAYDEPGRGRVMRLSVEADRLIVRTGRSRLPFRPIGDAEFVLVDRDFDGSLRFVGAETVAIDFGGEPFTLRRFQPVAPDLEEYTGEYYSEELRALYVATVSDGGLVLDGPRDVRFQLRPSIRDEFTAGPVVVRFRRDDGRVVAFDLDRRRVRGLRFHRR